MRGQDQLEAMRRKGFVPAFVVIETDSFGFDIPEMWSHRSPAIAQLQHEGKPNPADLRCIVDLIVSVHGTDESKVHAMRDACIKAGAKRTISTLSVARTPYRYEAIEVTDTDGILQWQP